MEKAAEFINEKYGENTVEIEIEDQYYNIGGVLKDHMHIVDTAIEAAKEVGLEPLFTAFRGGTDGSCLSHDGLPTSNIFIGGHNYHGRYEYVPVHAMEKTTEVIVKIVELYAKD